MPMRCARSPARPRTARKRGACWPWPRSTREQPAPRRPGSAGHGADRARLGGEIQRPWARGLDQPQAAGQPAKLTAAHRAALQAIVEQGPIPAIHGVVRWRLIDLIQWVWEEFRITISKQTLSRELRAMNYRKLSARPRHHAKNEAAVSAFKKTSPPAWRRSGRRSAASP